MGLFKKIKKAVKKVVRGAENVVRQQVGKDKIGESTRSDAADQMLKQSPTAKPVDVTKQAGAGQIKYTGEELT